MPPSQFWLGLRVSASPARMARFAHWVARHYGGLGPLPALRPIAFETLGQDLALARAEGVQRFWAVGGDGTANALGRHLAGTGAALGVIPVGSGNGFARHLGMSLHPARAIAQTLHAREAPCDLGTANGQPFLNVVGFGMDAEVIARRAGTHGFWAYARSTTRTLLHLAARPYTLELDGQPLEYRGLVGVIVANGTQFGYNARIMPYARHDDGLLDIALIRPFHPLQGAVMAARMFMGNAHKAPIVTTLAGRHFRITRRPDAPMHADGEPLHLPHATIDFEVRPGALRVLLPS